ncbi:MAG: NADH-quinone oxidoreductase subunit H [Planctomycetota bacterium]|nr:MAG: NADH-quinone oxidoreductase subunit H [Planctomycetota bacterium]
MWVDRKVTALIQSRIGPPWYQCYADIGKLLYKQVIIPAGSNRLSFVAAPLIGLAGISLAASIIWMVNINKSASFIGDLIVVMYLFVLPSLALIIGGAASRNPFSSVGASREMTMVFAYELPFILIILTAVIKTRSIIFEDIITYQLLNGAMIASASGILASIVFFICMMAKLCYLPFDIPEAESEIIGGTLAEYSGALLAIFKLTNAMMLLAVPLFLITLFLGGIDVSSIKGIVLLTSKYLIILVLVILVKSTHPRLRIDQALKFFLGPVTAIAVISVILAALGV